MAFQFYSRVQVIVLMTGVLIVPSIASANDEASYWHAKYFAELLKLADFTDDNAEEIDCETSKLAISNDAITPISPADVCLEKWYQRNGLELVKQIRAIDYKGAGYVIANIESAEAENSSRLQKPKFAAMDMPLLYRDYAIEWKSGKSIKVDGKKARTAIGQLPDKPTRCLLATSKRETTATLVIYTCTDTEFDNANLKFVLAAF